MITWFDINKKQAKSRMKVLVILLLISMTLETYGRMAMMDHHSIGEDMGKAQSTQGYYGGSSVDNHHNIPRDQYNSHGGGNTSQEPSGGGDEGGDTNN